MSNSIGNTPRIIRGDPPKKNLTENTYKKAKPYLLRDFCRRCAYSQQHTDRSLGEKTMEIDHFNPELKGLERNRYKNLLLSTRHCNGAKSSTWPSKAARKKGIHILNPCEERDFGVHIFEHPITHRLIGVTAAGDYHITTCDLNARHLVEERRDRARIHELLSDTDVTVKGQLGTFPTPETLLLREQLEKMIPMIPYLPKSDPAYDVELKLMGMLAQSRSV